MNGVMVRLLQDGAADQGTGRRRHEVSGVQGTEVRGTRLGRRRGRGVVGGRDGDAAGMELRVMVMQVQRVMGGEGRGDGFGRRSGADDSRDAVRQEQGRDFAQTERRGRGCSCKVRLLLRMMMSSNLVISVQTDDDQQD